MVRLLVLTTFASCIFSVCQTSSAQEFKTVIKGKIVDFNKNPIADANIFLINQTDRDAPKRKTKTDSEGEYSIEYQNAGTLVLVAQKNGLAIASQSIQILANQPSFEIANDDGLIAKTVNFELQAGNSFDVEFVDKDDQPLNLKSAIFRYCSSETEYISLYGSELELKVEGNKVFVDSVPDNSNVNIEMTHMNDIQFSALLPHDLDTEQIKIETNSVIEGTALDSNGDPLSNIFLSLSNWHSSGNPEKPKFSLSTNYECQTDTNGHFKFIVPSGTSNIRSQSDKFYLAGESNQQNSKANETSKIELRFKRTSEVNGRVIDENGNGVAGVELNVSNKQGGVTTDEEGNYSFRSNRNPAYISYFDVPEGFVTGIHRHNSIELPDDKPKVQAADIVLEASLPVSGIVVNSENQPVTGANVYAVWQQRDGRMSTGASDYAISDSAGKFTLKNTSRKSKLGITANANGAATCAVKLVNADDDRDNVKLVVETTGMIGLKGSVLDANGKPIPGAAISLKKAFVMPDGFIYGESRIFSEVKCLTSPTGKFEFPNKLTRTGKYSVSVAANGFTSFESPMLSCESGKSFIELSSIKINKTVSVAGKIVDQDGQPVANANVTGFRARERGRSGKVESTIATNGAGEFEINNLHPDCRILFVAKDGYRFRGFAFAVDQSDICFEIEKLANSSNQALSLFTRNESERISHLRQFATSQLASDKLSNYGTMNLFRMTRELDKEVTEQILDRLPDNYQKCGVLFSLDEFDEATEIASSQTTPRQRMSAFRLGALEVHDRETKIELLREAAAHANTIQDAGARIEAYGSIIEAMYDAGDLESAKALSQIALPIGLVHGYEGRGNFARGWLARATVELFPDQSLELIQGIEDQNSFDRHHGNLAHEMAAINPEFAEKLIMKIKRPDSRVAKVVYRMGPVDLARAESLIETTKFRENSQKANALGVLAYAIKETNSEKARLLLSQAVSIMLSEPEHRYTLGTTINLLRFATEVDPPNSNLYFWQLLKLYSDPNSDAWRANEAKSAAQLRVGKQALLLALFDKFPDVQKQLLRPILDDFRDFSDKNDPWFNDMTSRGYLFVAMTLAIPEETLEWCNWYYENVPPEKTRYIPQPREVIGWTLSKTPTEVANYAADELLNAWVIDKEDY